MTLSDEPAGAAAHFWMSTNARAVPRRSCHTGCTHTSPRSPAPHPASGSADPRGPNNPVLCVILHPVWAREAGFQPTEEDRLHVAGGGVLTGEWGRGISIHHPRVSPVGSTPPPASMLAGWGRLLSL